jgi:flagellar hook-length control protein FliK
MGPALPLSGGPAGANADATATLPMAAALSIAQEATRPATNAAGSSAQEPGAIVSAANGASRRAANATGEGGATTAASATASDGAQAGPQFADPMAALAAHLATRSAGAAAAGEPGASNPAGDTTAVAATGTAAVPAASGTLAASFAGISAQLAPASTLADGATYGPSVRTPVGHPGFGQDFSSQVVLLARGATQNAQIHLHPAELGPVSVSIQMNGQQATLSLQAAHEATREAMRQALPQLHEMFRAGGLELAQAQVGDGSSGNTPWRDAPAPRQGPFSRPGGAGGAAAGAAQTVPAPPAADRIIRLVDAWA